MRRTIPFLLVPLMFVSSPAVAQQPAEKPVSTGFRKRSRSPAPIEPRSKRRVVYAFDYAFRDHTMRARVLDAAADMLRMSKTPDEEVTIVALTFEVRVEQRFTKDISHPASTLAAGDYHLDVVVATPTAT